MADKAENAKTFGALLAKAITFPDGSLDTKEIEPKKAIALIVEELKVLPQYGANTIVASKGKLDEVAARLGELA
ncbi:MAG: hypothetical protein ACW985_02645 [Candidatus Thorarchaeota archaeon]|jgi:hypothetical protein